MSANFAVQCRAVTQNTSEAGESDPCLREMRKMMLEFMIQYSRDAGKSDAAREKKNFTSARIEGVLNSPSISKLGTPV